MQKRILALWVCEYYSGSTTDRFLKPFNNLGYDVDIISIERPGSDAEVFKALNVNEYDFMFHLPYPGSVRNETVKYVSSRIPSISWNGDDEWMWFKDYAWCRENALSHTMNVTTCEKSLKNYDSIGANCIVEQWGFSEGDWFKKNLKRNIDVYFCGSRNSERDVYLRALLDSGISAVIDGPGYGIHHKSIKLKEYKGGKVPLDVMIRRYQKSKIALNFTQGSRGDYKYGQVKARSFEIPATGTFQLSEHCEGLPDYFDYGDEIDTFRDPVEMIKKIKYYLSNERNRERIAARGYRRNRQYSYENIFRRVFDEIIHHRDGGSRLCPVQGIV